MAQQVVVGLTTNLKPSFSYPWQQKLKGTFGESSMSFFFRIGDKKLSVLKCKGNRKIAGARNFKIAGAQNATITTESVVSIDCRPKRIPFAIKITTKKGLASLVNNSIISPLYV